MYVCFKSFNLISVPNQENGQSCMCVLGETHIHDWPFSWFGTETKLKLLKHTYMTAHSPGLVQRQN
jgi:hypothetical protein